MVKEQLPYNTPCVLFVTHADVTVDPTVPVPGWSLSGLGRARHSAFNGREFIGDMTAIYCSAERKAIDGAEILSEATGLKFSLCEELGENDRSSTGFLPPPEFQETADLFFAHPPPKRARMGAGHRRSGARGPGGQPNSGPGQVNRAYRHRLARRRGHPALLPPHRFGYLAPDGSDRLGGRQLLCLRQGQSLRPARMEGYRFAGGVMRWHRA